MKIDQERQVRQKLDNWQRIEAIIHWANMTVNYFALSIGLPRGENLYQIKKGNNGISRNLADKITTKYPEISLSWLLTGEGHMFADKSLVGAQIPFVKADVESHIAHLEEIEPDHELIIPQLSDCDLAMLYNGKSMLHVVPSGSIVFLKKVDPQAVIPGNEYVVVSRRIVVLRTVRVSDGANEWRLVAADRENFDDLYVGVDQVEAVYRVAAVLEMKV